MKALLTKVLTRITPKWAVNFVAWSLSTSVVLCCISLMAGLNCYCHCYARDDLKYGYVLEIIFVYLSWAVGNSCFQTKQFRYLSLVRFQKVYHVITNCS